MAEEVSAAVQFPVTCSMYSLQSPFIRDVSIKIVAFDTLN